MVKECKRKEGVDARARSSPVLLQACLLGRQARLRCCWLGPCCCPVWGNWQRLQKPQKPRPPPCPAASPMPPTLFVGHCCPSVLLSLTPGLSVSVLSPQKGLFSYPGTSSRRRSEQAGRGARSRVSGNVQGYTPGLRAPRKPKGAVATPPSVISPQIHS